MKKTYIAPSILLEEMIMENMISTSYKIDTTKQVGGSEDESNGVGQLTNGFNWYDNEW